MRHDAGPAAVCEGLVRIYWSPGGEVYALTGVDAVVPAGRLNAITGPSAHKRRALRRRHIGYVFPRPPQNLLPHLTRPRADGAAGHRRPGAPRGRLTAAPRGH